MVDALAVLYSTKYNLGSVIPFMLVINLSMGKGRPRRHHLALPPGASIKARTLPA
jgi:hypothetical protein